MKDPLEQLEAWHRGAGDGERSVELSACDEVWTAVLREACYIIGRPATICVATGRGSTPAVALDAALAEARIERLRS